MVPLSFRNTIRITEAQRYHCKYDFTAASVILSPRVLFYCREIYFTAASFILLPRVLFYCREIYFTAASFVLLPRVLFSFSPPRLLFSPPRVLYNRREKFIQMRR